jgi:hypothetical protein
METYQIFFALAGFSAFAAIACCLLMYARDSMDFAYTGLLCVMLMIAFACIGGVLFAMTANNAPNTTSTSYPDALRGTPEAVMAYCSDMNREPGGWFADCVAWLEVMREIEGSR